MNLKAVSINQFEVLLIWNQSKSRCIKTYEIEYSQVGRNSFEQINHEPVLFSSFNHLGEFDCHKECDLLIVLIEQ